ncbi:MAG: hypothetical protein HY299_02510 [Verrucomicrobia bacterium]|nr:hypothetical protein [Verrucomicrobiota bacterium]
MKKAKSWRHRAAFAKVEVGVLVELGMHNPIATSIVNPSDLQGMKTDPFLFPTRVSIGGFDSIHTLNCLSITCEEAQAKRK